jgi:hypothetical protein
MEKDSSGFPPPAPITGWRKSISYVSVADETFALQENIMKIFSGEYPKGPIESISNYRLCRTRRMVENLFPITSQFPEYYGSQCCYNQKKLNIL